MQCRPAFMDAVDLGMCQSSKHLEQTSEESVARRSWFDVAIYFTSPLILRSWKGKLLEDLLSIILFLASKYKLQHYLQELLL